MNNPRIGGLLNLLVPGRGAFYAGKRLRRFHTYTTYPVVVVVLGKVAVPLLADFLVDAACGDPGDIGQSTLQGIAGLVILPLWLSLFPTGVLCVKRHNKKLAPSEIEAKKLVEQGSSAVKVRKLQEMLNAGLITQEDCEEKKRDLVSRF